MLCNVPDLRLSGAELERKKKERLFELRSEYHSPPIAAIDVVWRALGKEITAAKNYSCSVYADTVKPWSRGTDSYPAHMSHVWSSELRTTPTEARFPFLKLKLPVC